MQGGTISDVKKKIRSLLVVELLHTYWTYPLLLLVEMPYFRLKISFIIMEQNFTVA